MTRKSQGTNPISAPPIKGFDIYEVIGTGGMSTIYKAKQKSLDRIVAIKELSKACSTDTNLIERFFREARLAAALSHENIAHIYDYWTRGTSHCIVMEYVDGIDLSHILKRLHKLPPLVSLVIAHEVCRALAYAHSHHLVHRDIKPGNIMLTQRGEVKLMDFGIAQIPSMSTLTLPGTFLGTPAYMSPEQTMGKKLNPSSDQFSLGVVLYELLTGTKPFHEDEEKTIFERIRTADYPAPRKVDPEIPRVIANLVRKALQPNPKARFLTTLEMNQRFFKVLRKKLRGDPRKFLRNYLETQEIISPPLTGSHNGDEFEGEDGFNLSGLDMVFPESTVKYGLSRFQAFLKPQNLYRVIRNICLILLPTWALWLVHNPTFPRLGIRPVIGQITQPRPKEQTRVRIHAKPWALVYWNDTLIGMTPTAEEFNFPNGMQRFSFHSPHFEDQELKIFLNGDQNQLIHVDLAKPN